MSETHNRLTLIERLPRQSGNEYGLWRCECGGKHRAQMAKVRGGRIKSCGCLRRGVLAKGWGEITPFKLATMRWA